MSLREQFDELSAERILAFIHNKQVEHLYLDFKMVVGAGLGSRDDRKNLATAISGFANADGGIVIWGVEARQNSDGIDCACEPKPISPLAGFVAALNKFTGEAANPIVDGVEHRTFIKSGDSGFAATLVPSSDSGPHMAKLGEDRYYKRTGDRFAKMEHYEIQDMFGRRRRPVLRLRCRTESDSRVIISIENSGRSSAIHLSRNQGEGTSPGGQLWHRWKSESRATILRSTDKKWCHFGSGMDTVIHPGTVRDITKVVIGGQTLLTIDFKLAADGMQTKMGDVRFVKAEFHRAGVKKASE